MKIDPGFNHGWTPDFAFQATTGRLIATEADSDSEAVGQRPSLQSSTLEFSVLEHLK